MTKPKILIVDDRMENLFSLELLLEKIDCEIVKASSGNEALLQLSKHRIALVLLDAQMPEMDGFEAATLMRQNKKTSDIPIIFVAATSKDQNRNFPGYESGDVDYICKPFDPATILAKVSIFLELYRYRCDLGKMQKELCEQKRILERLSITDELTGLYTRRHLNNILKQEFERGLRYETPLACLMLALDNCNVIKDTYGNNFSDIVLREFTKRICKLLRSSDISFRFGGEKVLVLLPQTDIEGAKQTAEKIRLRCEAEPVSDANHTTAITVTIGVAANPLHQAVLHGDLITFADKALYHAKENGRNRVEEYIRS
jgi:diguanylate cyclase (GGDEF)-like protein